MKPKNDVHRAGLLEMSDKNNQRWVSVNEKQILKSNWACALTNFPYFYYRSLFRAGLIAKNRLNSEHPNGNFGIRKDVIISTPYRGVESILDAESIQPDRIKYSLDTKNFKRVNVVKTCY